MGHLPNIPRFVLACIAHEIAFLPSLLVGGKVLISSLCSSKSKERARGVSRAHPREQVLESDLQQLHLQGPASNCSNTYLKCYAATRNMIFPFFFFLL